MKRVSETTPIPAKTFTLQEGVIPPVVTQTKVASPTTPLVISTSDPFAALSQATKDGFSLMVTSSSIPSSATVDLMQTCLLRDLRMFLRILMTNPP